MRVMKLLPISPWAARVSGWPRVPQHDGPFTGRAAVEALDSIARRWDELAACGTLDRMPPLPARVTS